MTCWHCQSRLIVPDAHEGNAVCLLCGRPQVWPAWWPSDREKPVGHLTRVQKAHRGIETKVRV